MFWDNLNECWREVVEQSWESYKNNTIPVGAVILDENGNIISRGRNVLYDEQSGHLLAGSPLGHAEMVALSYLKKEGHPNVDKYSVYASLEPCPMCLGAIMMMGIKDVYFAATDGAAGSTILQDITEYIEEKGVRVMKQGGDIEVFQIVLQTSRGHWRPVRKIIETWEEEHRGAVELGEILYSEKFFESAIRNDMDITEIYEFVLARYYSNHALQSFTGVVHS